jgi:hypothetical protein
MHKKEELLRHYVDVNYGNIKRTFPMLLEEIDIKSIKENIDTEDKVYNQKRKIDNVFKDKMAEYLNAKFDIAQLNVYFIKSRHDIFEFDYELADKLLWFNNYIWNLNQVELPYLRNDITISDSKEIVREFFHDLLKDNPNDITKIDYIIDNKINISYDEKTATTDINSNIINITYTPDLYFLIIIAHEVAHSLAYYNKDDLLGPEDVRCVEIESSFIEKLFIKYLKDNELPIIEEDKKIRPINDEDIDKFYVGVFGSIIRYAYAIIDELDFVESLEDKPEITRESLDRYILNCPYTFNYSIKAYCINEILNNYIEPEYHNLTIGELKEAKKDIGLYTYNEFGSFEFNIRYLFSYLLSNYFEDMLDDPRTIKYFKKFLDNKNDYSTSDICNLIGFDIEDSITLPSVFVDRYYKILEKNDIKTNKNIYADDNYIERDLDYYKKILDKAKKSDRKEQDKDIILRELLHLYNSTNIRTGKYPFDINSQMDDCDVDRVKELTKRIEELQ